MCTKAEVVACVRLIRPAIVCVDEFDTGRFEGPFHDLECRAPHMEDLSGDWRRLDERIEHITKEIEVLAGTDVNCGQLMTVPGIGPIVASATVAAIGNGAAFARGRDFAAWLGLVPKQMSTGDRTILGRITKRGNRYLRMLFVQGARAIETRMRSGVRGYP